MPAVDSGGKEAPAFQASGLPHPLEMNMAAQYFRSGYTVVEAVQYGLAEYADNPWEIRGDEIPQWLIGAARDGKVVPEFRSEDYWYLLVTTPQGQVHAGPDDWIGRDTNDVLRVVTSAEMRADWRAA